MPVAEQLTSVNAALVTSPGRPARGLLRGRLRLWLTRIADRVRRPQAVAFYRILGGYTFFQLLSSAVELDLFTLLARTGRLNREQISRALELEERPTRVLLLGCTVLGLIRRRLGSYRNSWLAARYLNADSPHNIISIVRWQHHINYQAMFKLTDSLRANTNLGLEALPGVGLSLFDKLERLPDLQAIFHRAMTQQSANVAECLVQHLDFGRFNHVTDVGGGDGAYLIEIAKRFPELRGEVLDLPGVCEIARRNIAAEKLGHRLGVRTGEPGDVSFTSGSDCILFAHFLTLWSEANVTNFLQKAHEALPVGGAVIIFSIMQEDSEDAPFSSAIGSAYFLTIATGQSLLWTWSEYESWLRLAGFRKIWRHRLTRDHGAIVAIR